MLHPVPAIDVTELTTQIQHLIEDNLNNRVDAAIADQMHALLALRERVETAVLLTAGVYDARSCSITHGLTTAQHLAHIGRLSGADAHQIVTAGRVAFLHDHARDAITTGDIDAETLKGLGIARRGREDLFDTHLDTLLGALILLRNNGGTVKDQTEIRKTWQHMADDNLGKGQPNRDNPNRRLSLAPTTAGMVSINGLLDQTRGAELLAAIADLAQPHPNDTRTLQQRQADAMGELARRHLEHRNTGNGPVATIDITIDADTLAHLLNLNHHQQHPHPHPEPDNETGDGEAGDGAHSEAGDGGGRLGRRARSDAEEWWAELRRARLIAQAHCKESMAWLLSLTPQQLCNLRRHHHQLGVLSDRTLLQLLGDAWIGRAVLNADSEIIDLGRRVRVATAAQKRAKRLERSGCSINGCTAAQAWIEYDHTQPWEHGGPTDLANLRPLCGKHHHLRHQGWTLTPQPHGGYTLTPPNTHDYPPDPPPGPPRNQPPGHPPDSQPPDSRPPGSPPGHPPGREPPQRHAA